MGRPLKTLPPKPGKTKLLIKQGSASATEPETIADVMTLMKQGGVYQGFLKGGNTVRKADYVQTEDLDAEQQEARSLIRRVLAQVIEPNQLSMRSTPEMDKRSLTTKLNRSLMSDLKKMLPDRLRDMTVQELKEVVAGLPDTITDDERAEIQERYKDVSP